MARVLKHPCPVVRARARLHTDHARRQRRDRLVQLASCHGKTNQFRLAGIIHTVDRENILGEINTNGHISHGLPLASELTSSCTSHRGARLPFAATRRVQDGEVSFIR